MITTTVPFRELAEESATDGKNLKMWKRNMGCDVVRVWSRRVNDEK